MNSFMMSYVRFLVVIINIFLDSKMDITNVEIKKKKKKKKK